MSKLGKFNAELMKAVIAHPEMSPHEMVEGLLLAVQAIAKNGGISLPRVFNVFRQLWDKAPPALISTAERKTLVRELIAVAERLEGNTPAKEQSYETDTKRQAELVSTLAAVKELGPWKVQDTIAFIGVHLTAVKPEEVFSLSVGGTCETCGHAMGYHRASGACEHVGGDVLCLCERYRPE